MTIYHCLSLTCVIVVLASEGTIVHGHTRDQIKDELGITEAEIPEGLSKMTEAYGTQQPGPIREQLHSAQHQMMLDHLEFLRQQKCVRLVERLATTDRRIKELKKSGELEQVKKLEELVNRAQAFGSIYCAKPQ